ncbi:hypothetical protein [Clostridium sp.]
MKINLLFRNIIILISITTFLKGSSVVECSKKEKDFKNKYGVQLVFTK